MNEAQRQDEIFDVVDEHDRVIGQATRGKVHREGLLHRAVHVLVRRANGDVLMQKRSMRKDSAPGKWTSSCSGHLDAGESYEEAAVRELKEELGVQVESAEALELLFKHSACEDTANEFVCVYAVLYEGDDIRFNPNEIDAVKWISMKAIAEWLSVEPTAIDRPFKLIFKRISSV